MLKLKKMGMVVVILLTVMGMAMSGVAKEVEKITIQKININKASIEELTTLDRVGKQYAQRIIDFREKNGPFQKPEDITRVKGIGDKIWEANKDVIIVK
ncbi:MAG: helix-hairpin-helix domain-containing protein [Pseudomonadota bacterium]